MKSIIAYLLQDGSLVLRLGPIEDELKPKIIGSTLVGQLQPGFFVEGTAP